MRLRMVHLGKYADSAFLCALIVAVAYGVFILARLAIVGNPSAFILAGARYVNIAAAPRGLAVEHGAGYDGQFFYRLALNPFDTRQTAYGVRLDRPSYREQRILYPLVVWLFSFGQAPLVPVMMILVNYLALIALGYVFARYVRLLGRHALWGLVAPFYPGFVLSVARDLAEPLAGLLLVASLYFVHRKRFTAATIALTLAILTRETIVLVAGAALLLWLIGLIYQRYRQRHPGETPLAWLDAFAMPWFFSVIPLAVFVVWQGILLLIWKETAFASGSGNLGVPFGGFAQLFGQAVLLKNRFERLHYVEQLFILIYVFFVGVSLRITQAPIFQRIAWCGFIALSFCLTPLVWVDDWAFLRALSDSFMLGAPILLAGRLRYAAPVFLFFGMLWGFLALTRLFG